MELDANKLSLITGAGAVSGVIAEEYLADNTGFGNNYVNIAIGVGLALLGYFTDFDGVSDFIEAFGIGFVIPAGLRLGLGVKV
ncbi:MAG: hypothetical protein ACP5U0_07500 [Caldisphaera sp.]